MILAILLATLFNTVSSTSTSCSGTTYSVPFPYGATGSTPNLTVAAAGVTLSYPSAWTVNKISSTSTGTITLATACTGTLTITRTTPRTQPTSYRTQGTLDLAVLETNLDRIEMQMQESVVQGGGAALSSLTLTTPLPVASGGTGAAPPNCGAGVLTSNGTSFSCVTLSGLAPPGTTGILLQSASPGSFQIGHENLRGNMILRQAFGGGGDNNPPNAFWNSALLGDGSNQVNALGGWFYTGGNIGGGFGPLGGGFGGGLRFAPAGFNSANVGSGMVYAFAGSKGTTNMIEISGWGAATGGSALGTTLAFSGCQYQWPCIQTMTTNGTGSALYLAGQSGLNTANNAVYVDTNANRLVAGPVFGVRNNNANVFTVDITGVVASAGITSTGPVSGTTGSFTGGATIGTGGTAISGSFRGTKSWTPGALGACSGSGCQPASTTITVTGAAAGADCIAGVVPPETITGFSPQCIVSANSCQISLVNQSAFTMTFGAATYYCRVFNP